MDADGAGQRPSRGYRPINDSLEGGIHHALKHRELRDEAGKGWKSEAIVDPFIELQQSGGSGSMGDVMQSKSAVGTPPTVLVVDDEAPMRAFERRILESVGYCVLEATNGAEGIDRLAGDARLDLLIADLEMPVLGGDEMARRIRLARPDLRVLYVTGHIDRLMDARPLWEGEAFLEKPFSDVGLLEAVSLLLHGTTRWGQVESGTN